MARRLSFVGDELTKRANKVTLEECMQEKDVLKNKFQFIIEKQRAGKADITEVMIKPQGVTGVQIKV